MKLISSKEIDYAPKPNQGSWILDNTLPPDHLISSCFGVIQYQGKWVLIEHISRGLEIPGGHKEPQEKALDCFLREIKEECAISFLTDIELIGYQKIEVFAKVPHDYKYPYPVSYQCIFKAKAISLDQFVPNLDSKSRHLINKKNLKNMSIYKQYDFLFES